MVGIVVLFNTIFAPKTDHVFSIFSVGMRSISITDSCVYCCILALLSAHQEYPVAFKLMTSQVVQRV